MMSYLAFPLGKKHLQIPVLLLSAMSHVFFVINEWFLWDWIKLLFCPIVMCFVRLSTRNLHQAWSLTISGWYLFVYLAPKLHKQSILNSSLPTDLLSRRVPQMYAWFWFVPCIALQGQLVFPCCLSLCSTVTACMNSFNLQYYLSW